MFVNFFKFSRAQILRKVDKIYHLTLLVNLYKNVIQRDGGDPVGFCLFGETWEEIFKYGIESDDMRKKVYGKEWNNSTQKIHVIIKTQREKEKNENS